MKKPIEFCTKHRAKFSQIDSMKILNNEHYLSYFMEHRTSQLRDRLGWNLDTIMTLPVLFVVEEVTIKYKRPIFGDSPFTINSRVTEINRTDIFIGCEMTGDKGAIHSTCKMTVTAIEPKTMRPTDWPEDIIEKFYEESHS